MLVGAYFVIKPYFLEADQLKENPKMVFEQLNSMLIFMGLALSFSSLQDTSKTQNNFSKKIWESPKKGKLFIVIICCQILGTLIFGLVGYFIAEDGMIKELSIGAIVLGLGMFGFLKGMIELFENHRLDKKAPLGD